jgi:hypothetical protein
LSVFSEKLSFLGKKGLGCLRNSVSWAKTVLAVQETRYLGQKWSWLPKKLGFSNKNGLGCPRFTESSAKKVLVAQDSLNLPQKWS